MANFTIDSDLVRKMAALLDETGLGEIEYEVEGHRIRVAKPGTNTTFVGATAAGVSSAVPVSADTRPATEPQMHPGAVKSPMVGTVYLSASPSEPPFVQVGQTVTEGQALMLVEAMKTYNEIKAPRSGTLKSLLVENGQPVEFDEVLAIIE